MKSSAEEFIRELFKSAHEPISEERIFEALQDHGHKAVTRGGLGQHLGLLRDLGLITQEIVPKRSGLGWVLTKAAKRRYGVLPPETTEQETAGNSPDAAQRAHDAISSKLWNWQAEALSKWERSGRRAIVEAVTGSGKTMVGLAACAKMQLANPQVHTLVVVPTIVLMEQWRDRFERELPHVNVGLIGDGHDDDFRLGSVCIATVHSAMPRLESLFAHRKRMGIKTLLIADECHRYIGPPVFGKLLDFPFDFTLGLSATVGAAGLFDGNVIRFTIRGLGSVIVSYTFGMAMKDGHVPPFTMVNIPVRLASYERHEYDRFCELIREQMVVVRRCYEEELRYLDPSQEKFWRTLKALQKRGGGDDPVITRLFALMFKRAAISYKAEAKMRLALQILLLMLNEGRKKVLVFFERIQSAQDLEGDLKDGDSDDLFETGRLDVVTADRLREELLKVGRNWCRVIHSGLRREKRKQILQDFRKAGVAALLACRVLDEGFDVPEIDVAILVASTKSARQRIQRIGRALRKGNGQKRPIVITLYVPETGDAEVVANDQELFGDAATIYQEGESSCVARLKSFLEA